jgi:tRNA(His) 5'-end guanylyltransferase
MSLQSAFESFLQPSTEVKTDEKSPTLKLDDRMKIYEHMSDISVPHHLPFIIRLDGNNFSAFTKKLKKPFDKNFTKAMVLTMTDLMDTFNAQTAYTHSDEITLIFGAACTKEQLTDPRTPRHLFNGRIGKLTTESASLCSLRFTHHLHKLIDNDNTFDYTVVKQILSDPHLNFDARVLVFPEDKTYEIVNHMIWRSMRDCPKNCISKVAETFYSAKQLHGKNSVDKEQMVKEKNFDYDNYDPYLKNGIYCKNEAVEFKNDKDEVYRRNKPLYKTLLIDKYDDQLLNLMTSKIWIKVENVERYSEILIDINSIHN